jgi:hypothetical protein
MAYTIRKSDGTSITVPDNAIDTEFYNPLGGSTGTGLGVQLVGRYTIDYGTAIAQNFLQITENFASATGTFPSDSTALQGQLWFDKTLGALYVRVTDTEVGLANWRKLASIADPAAVTGYDGQVKVVGAVIYIWADSAWKQVFPAVYS